MLADNGPAKLWPFETGFGIIDEDALDGVSVLAAEVHSAIYDGAAQVGEVKDATAVRLTAEALADLDDKGQLGALFAPPKGAEGGAGRHRRKGRRLDAGGLKVLRHGGQGCVLARATRISRYPCFVHFVVTKKELNHGPLGKHGLQDRFQARRDPGQRRVKRVSRFCRSKNLGVILKSVLSEWSVVRKSLADSPQEPNHSRSNIRVRVSASLSIHGKM
ncbi:MAG: hypothetical protein WDN06_18305 [Asticcacaulis sp.]